MCSIKFIESTEKHLWHSLWPRYFPFLLILITPRNMLKLHAKNICTKCDKIIELNNLRFLCYSLRVCWLVQVYIGSFFNRYITLPWYWWEIDEIANFQNFLKLCSQINLLCFFRHFGTPFSNRKNETKWQGT